MVGMGMPRQEFWTQENFSQLDAHVILSSTGAALEYIAGATPTPPRWSGRIGLEWMFRLAHEPRRLFSRYLIEPWYILLLLLMDYPRSRYAAKEQGRAQATYAGSDEQSSPIQMRGD
jgi:N-acetylglucosaminyldiphosphoundecaprenol N-acetyl-beta-D-mannosaminyltransferase